MLETCRG